VIFVLCQQADSTIRWW